MSDFIQLKENIKYLHYQILIFRDKNINLEDFPSIQRLIEEFSKVDNEWRYYFETDIEELFKELLTNMVIYLVEPNLRKLSKIEANTSSLLKLFESYRNSSKNFTSEVIDLEKQLQSDLKLSVNEYQFNEKLLKLEAYFEEKGKKLDIEHHKIISAQKETNRIIDELKSKNEAFSQLIDEDSNKRIKELYEELYMQEIQIADKYRKWALWIFAAVCSFLLIGFLIVSIQNWNHLRNPSFIEIKLGWDSLFKTLMLFSLTTPAWYLTKESSKHRQVAYKAKMLGTELAAFPLYAREFKDEERLELRKNLADRFFGQELYGSSSPKADNSASSTEQIKLLAEMNKVTVEAIKVQQTLLGKRE